MTSPTAFRYRAVRGDGSVVGGQIDAASEAEALAQIRRNGSTPIELRVALSEPALASGRNVTSSRARAASRALIGELAVLLKAGLPLDRALALAIDNCEDSRAVTAMDGLLRAVREGAPLSQAMLANPVLFSPGEAAMAEAGEANGQLGEALERLAQMQEQAAELQRMFATAAIYPIVLLVIAVGVILFMLLFVVPQFERVIESGNHATLPAASMVVIGASRFLRDYGLWLLGLIAVAGFALRQALARPESRMWLDRVILSLPQLGELVRRIETARFSHTLSALLEGGVGLPAALTLSQRTIGNSVIAGVIGKIAEGVREGGGLSAPLAASGILPRLAIGFIRTGEETSRLAMMLERLAVVLDRDVRTRLERLVAFLTPAITVVLGATVAAIVASIMSAILGFNDLALAQ